MEQINNIINFFKNITQNQLIDCGIALIIIAVFFILSPFLSYLIIKMFKFKEKDKSVIKNNAFYKPLKFLFITTGIYVAILILQLSENIMAVCTKAYTIILICIVANAAINIGSPFCITDKTEPIITPDVAPTKIPFCHPKNKTIKTLNIFLIE